MISWQRSSGGGDNDSRFGVEGGEATLPAGLTVRDGDNIIACEAFYHYQPMLFEGVLEETTLYRFAVLPPPLRQARRHLSVAFWRASPHPRFALPLPGGRGLRKGPNRRHG